MAELTFIEIAGLTLGISGMNLGIIMAYIRMKTDHLEKALNEKWNKGQKQHKEIYERIDTLES